MQQGHGQTPDAGGPLTAQGHVLAGGGDGGAANKASSGGAQPNPPPKYPGKRTLSLQDTLAILEHTIVWHFSGKVRPIYRGELMDAH